MNILSEETIKQIVMIQASAKHKGDFLKHYDMDDGVESGKAVAKAQMKKLLLGISKETKKLDGTIYLVPDYSKFKEALEEMNDVQTY